MKEAPAHVVLALAGDATLSPLGRSSVNVTLVSATLDGLVLATVKVNVVMPFNAIGSGEKDLLTVGGVAAVTQRVPVNVILSTKRFAPLWSLSAPEPVI